MHGLLFFGTIWSTMDQKTSENGHFPRRIVFTLLLGFAVFRPQVPFQTAKNAVFSPKSESKSPDHALEKVLTDETPSKIAESLFRPKKTLKTFRG